LSKNILKYIILFITYLALFYSLNLIPAIPQLFKTVIFIISGLLTFGVYERYLNSFLYRYSLRFTKHLEYVINEFEHKLNSKYNYYEFLDELKIFFDLICKNKSWIFYVVEEESFYIAATSISIVKSDLPSQLDTNKFDEAVFAHSFEELKMPNINGFDYVIIFPGKNDHFGLLCSKSSNFNFLKDKKLKSAFQNIVMKAGQVLENTALYFDLLEKNRQIKKIFEVSDKILTTINTDQILEFLLDALDDIILFDAAVIFLFDEESNKLYRNVSKGYNEDTNLTLKIGQGACGWVAENKKTSILEDVTKADQYYPVRTQTRSQVALPLQIHDELIGVLCLESNQVGHFTQKSQEILNLFAHQAVIALNNAKQYEVFLKKQHFEHELIRAGKIQQVLLPSQPPTYSQLNIAFAHIPSEIVSGDLFDLAPLNEETLAIVVGDVSGKGAHAAIMMTLVLAGFRAFKKTHLAVCEVVARLNNLLEESISVGNYATLYYALVSLKHQSIVYTNAGHNPPYLIRTDGSIVELTGGGIMIGFLRDQLYSQHEVAFNEGDLFVAYTDGITEAMNSKEEEFGEERLKRILIANRKLNSYELKNKILTEISNFTGQKHQSDDMTLVIIKHT
jgi:phosphoserine phosphatase RsbU/P